MILTVHTKPSSLEAHIATPLHYASFRSASWPIISVRHSKPSILRCRSGRFAACEISLRMNTPPWILRSSGLPLSRISLSCKHSANRHFRINNRRSPQSSALRTSSIYLVILIPRQALLRLPPRSRSRPLRSWRESPPCPSRPRRRRESPATAEPPARGRWARCASCARRG